MNNSTPETDTSWERIDKLANAQADKLIIEYKLGHQISLSAYEIAGLPDPYEPYRRRGKNALFCNQGFFDEMFAGSVAARQAKERLEIEMDIVNSNSTPTFV